MFLLGIQTMVYMLCLLIDISSAICVHSSIQARLPAAYWVNQASCVVCKHSYDVINNK